MKSLVEQMSFYQRYHLHAMNRLTHFFGVPLIMFSLLIPLSMLTTRFGDINLAHVVGIALLIYYFRLDWLLALAMTVVLSIMLALAQHVAHLTSSSAWLIFALCFVGGWILQLIGHKIEGKRPALVDNFFQVFVAPIFLMAELFFMLGYRRTLHAEVLQRANACA